MKDYENHWDEMIYMCDNMDAEHKCVDELP